MAVGTAWMRAGMEWRLDGSWVCVDMSNNMNEYVSKKSTSHRHTRPEMVADHRHARPEMVADHGHARPER